MREGVASLHHLPLCGVCISHSGEPEEPLCPPSAGESVTPVLQLFCTVEGGCPSAYPYSPSPCGVQELVMCFIALNVSSITQPEGTWLSPLGPALC